ncbi:HAD family hydrolase, partial [archaeon]
MLPQASLSLVTMASNSINPIPVTLVTFDVDGTLVQGSSTAPEITVHAKAFLHAAGRVAGKQDAFERQHASPLDLIAKHNYHGCTDGLISLHLMKNAFGLPADQGMQKLDAVFSCMYEFVNQVEDSAITHTIVPIEGVLETLSRLRDMESLRGRVLCGLVTGNVEGIARKKMRATGIFGLGLLSPPASDQEGCYPGTEDCAFLGGFGSDFCSGDIEDETRQ